jgi:hypothetical protein
MSKQLFNKQNIAASFRAWLVARIEIFLLLARWMLHEENRSLDQFTWLLTMFLGADSAHGLVARNRRFFGWRGKERLFGVQNSDVVTLIFMLVILPSNLPLRSTSEHHQHTITDITSHQNRHQTRSISIGRVYTNTRTPLAHIITDTIAQQNKSTSVFRVHTNTLDQKQVSQSPHHQFTILTSITTTYRHHLHRQITWSAAA